MGSKPKTPPQDPALTEINQITLLRLKREEEQLAKTEAEQERILAANQRGRSALLSRGYLGPGSTAVAPRSPRTALPSAQSEPVTTKKGRLFGRWTPGPNARSA